MNSIKSILILGFATVLIFGILYPLAMVGLGNLVAPYAAQGKPLYRNGTLVGFENLGQPFNNPEYFWGRPSAVGYNAAATGGSNKGPNDPGYLEVVQSRIDTLLKYHPGLKVEDIPVDMVTASGGGLDPHISQAGALMQITRIAQVRNLPPKVVRDLVPEYTEPPLWGFLGPGDQVNVLKLNLALDQLTDQINN
ncbi:MAG: potassium-transporting ATPase subunit KdpC [Bacteroidia bacterium]|nr:potassium-transporting ATPase subunit KdpC [Bacteroidia bacterium]